MRTVRIVLLAVVVEVVAVRLIVMWQYGLSFAN